MSYKSGRTFCRFNEKFNRINYSLNWEISSGFGQQVIPEVSICVSYPSTFQLSCGTLPNLALGISF